MSGGGGSGETTSYQTNLPEYAEPYYKEMMARTQAESIKPYTPYEGQRVAGFTQGQQMAADEIYSLERPEVVNAAEMTLAEATNQLAGMEYTPNQFSTDYQATPYDTAYQAGQFDPGYQAGTFDAETAEQYMDPYMRQVLDVQKRQAQQEYQRGRAGTAAEAVQAGAFGGSRFGVREAEQEAEYLDRLAEIEATGLSQAYQQGREQFGIEQGLEQQEAQMGLSAQEQAEAARQQEEAFRQSAEQMTEQEAQFAADLAQQVATSQEAADQFAAQYGQDAVGVAIQAADAQRLLGQTQQNLDVARAQAQFAMGQEEQMQAQRLLDQAYNDFVNARDNERQQLAFYNALLRGIPVPVQQETITTGSTAGFGSQLAGLGIAGLGAYNTLGGQRRS